MAYGEKPKKKKKKKLFVSRPRHRLRRCSSHPRPRAAAPPTRVARVSSSPVHVARASSSPVRASRRRFSRSRAGLRSLLLPSARLPFACRAEVAAPPIRAQGRGARGSRSAAGGMRARRPDRAARDAPGAGAQMEQSAPLLPGPCHVFFEKSAPLRWPWFMASPTLHPLSDSESEFNRTKTPARIQKKVHEGEVFDRTSFSLLLHNSSLWNSGKACKVSVEIRVILCRTSVYRLMTPLTVVQCSNDL